MVLTPPGIPGMLFEVWSFLPGPWKTTEKADNFPVLLETWNFEDNFHLFYKQTKTCRNIWLMIVLFVFYVDWISINAATAAEITCFLGLGLGSFFSLENSWNFVETFSKTCKTNRLKIISFFCFAKEEFEVGKINYLPWKTPGILLSSVSTMCKKLAFRLLAFCWSISTMKYSSIELRNLKP